MPREFYKSIKHNGHLYTLHSIYDDTDFDSQVRAFLSDRKNRKNVNKRIARIRRFHFDSDIHAYDLSDDLQQLYNTNLFD